eukprot:scaffold254512_cov41-Tisochrysis_lutea.AAC.1
MIGSEDDTLLLRGDFNCVENIETNTITTGDHEGYGNAHGPRLKAVLNTMGLTDAHTLVNGQTRSGFTRLSGTVHTAAPA